MSPPLVSVICLCYNHVRFVEQAIQSVLDQRYPNIQLIVVDDASTDNSVVVIQKIILSNPAIEFVALPKNLGNCKAFNRGLALANGEFIIDLAADDVLLPDRVAVGVEALTKSGKEYGVHFSDAVMMSEEGLDLYFHSEKFPHTTIPQGDVYNDIIRRYFICPPTVMFTRGVAEDIGGYDETLSYEDFDFWIRSSRKFKYVYSPEALVKKRVSKNALINKQFKFFSKHSTSTYRVCEKILELNKCGDEQQALTKRIWYEISLNLRLLNVGIVLKYFSLLAKNKQSKYG